MGFTLSINGFCVSCQNPTDVLELIKAAQGTSLRRGPGRPPRNGVSTRQQQKEDQERAKTVAFLQSLLKNGGADADDVVAALGLKGGRGIGGALVTVKRVLRHHGLDPEGIFSVEQNGLAKHWLPTRKTTEAVTRLKETNGSAMIAVK